MISPLETQQQCASSGTRLSSWPELLSIALIVTAAAHAIPNWVCEYILPYGFKGAYDWANNHLGFGNFYDTVALLFGVILAAPAPRRNGLCIGAIQKHWWRVLIVMAIPITLTAIVYPRLSVRPFAGASISMWLISPLAQDLVFVGYIYGRFAERGEGLWRHAGCRSIGPCYWRPYFLRCGTCQISSVCQQAMFFSNLGTFLLARCG